ncbi:hypothetical protein C7405_110200 [Paraburkholderia caballeronis]|uniref:hypothetical protein n=1 Tax=Paraburkholderia caballeronis TaxID=416943 RepID=UPI0010D2F818|nr:hypothetical protein [Paraburkholderia caballeronis]TDV33949.1 hypothetical protein C7405_110200 [Paraburkholderia caballeronis]
MNAHRRPRLTLIGALGVLAGVSLVAGCDNESNSVDVERARYATREECELDWARPDDCVYVDDTQPASDAAASGSGGTTASGGGSGGHAGGGGAHGGRWSGPYYTRSGRVYHSDGGETDERISTRHADAVTESRLADEGGHLGAISRGGFGESARGGGEGEGGGHGGGGEGGGGHGGGGHGGGG